MNQSTQVLFFHQTNQMDEITLHLFMKKKTFIYKLCNKIKKIFLQNLFTKELKQYDAKLYFEMLI